MPKVTYRVHDPDINHTFETSNESDVHNYAKDDFITDTPIHVTTLHDGKEVSKKLISPSDYHGDTFTNHMKAHFSGKSFAFRKQ